MKNYVAYGVLAITCVIVALVFMYVNIHTRQGKWFSFMTMWAALLGALVSFVMFCITVLGAVK